MKNKQHTMKNKLIMLCLAAGCALGLSSCGEPTFSDDKKKNEEILNGITDENKKSQLKAAIFKLALTTGSEEKLMEAIKGKTVDEVIEYANSL